MKKFKTIIIDDEPIAIDIIKRHLEQLSNFEIVASFTNALDSLALLHNQHIDLLFLDIEMPGITGLEFAKSLPRHTSVIFTTAYRNYAVDAFDLEVIDYLLKPISFDRFLRAINRFYAQHNASPSELLPLDTQEQIIEVKADKKTYKVRVNEILYIESVEDYVKIHTTSQRLLIHTRMHQIESMLDKNIFVRIHRSYLINKKHISAYSSTYVEIGEQNIPIGRTYREEVGLKIKGL